MYIISVSKIFRKSRGNFMFNSKLGRNDPCPCGSGRKYKKCHLNKQDLPPKQSFISQRSIKERNIILYNAIWDIFGFSKGKNWNDFRREMSDDQVRELYRVIGWLWPTNTDIISLLPKADTSLRGFYMGETRPGLNSILQNIVRYSLYSDELLVVSPFYNPMTIAPQYNPVVHTELYKQDTLEMVAFMFRLAPWIEAGIVSMIPNPCDFDPTLRRSVWDMARKRWEEQKLDITDETKAKIEPRGKAMLAKTMYRLPKDQLAISIKRALPRLTNKELEDQIKYIQKLRENDPMILNRELPAEGELQVMRYGANLELALYIGQLTGSYLYTDIPEQWREILSSAQNPSGEGEMWSPLTKSFQELEFKFLSNIDPKFAYRLKEEGRLEKFRSFLRRVWIEIGGNPSYEQANKLARQFAEELQEEYGKTKEEWAEIDKELMKWLAGPEGIVGLISGAMNWQIPALGFCIRGVGKLLEARTNRKNFKENVPLAIFLELDNKKKTFK